MKKFFVLALVFLFCSFAIAESNISEGATIRFRDFEWYAPFEEVDATMIRSSDATFMSHMDFENTTIDSINGAEWEYMYSDDRVDEGGVCAYYYDISVAGYLAEAELYYIYPIVNNTVRRDKNDAQLYLATYSISDLADMQAVYEDLNVKLSSLYGAGTDKSSNDFDGMYWQDSIGNAIWLVYETNETFDYSQIRIAYAAGGHIERLAELEAQIELETRNAEEESRQENSGNTSGL